MTWIDIDQLSTDWLHMRCGSPTASHLADIMAKLKDPKKESAARFGYKRKKIAECLTGLSMDSFVSQAMEEGMEREPLARAAYEIERDCEVLPGGLFVHDTIPRWMASPDGRVGNDGLIEIKCCADHNHLDILLTEEIPEQYQLQMLGQLSCSGRQWVDFVAYNPNMPKEHKLWIKRFPRDEAMISAVELEVQQFLEEMVATLKKLGAVKEEVAA